MNAYKSGTITHAQILDMVSTPIQLVRAPGKGYILEYVSAVLFFDYTAAYAAGAALIISVGPAGGSANETVPTTFLQATADSVAYAPTDWDGAVYATADYENLGIYMRCLTTPYTGGSASNKLRYKITYRIWPINH